MPAPKQRLTTPILSLLLTLIANVSYAGEWEIKSDLEYTDGARSDVTTYDGGSFDKRKVKYKYKTKLETLLTYTEESSIDNLKYSYRFGYIYKRSKDNDLQLREDGSVKKDKTRTEVDRITYAGMGGKYKLKDILGADKWTISARFDYYLDVSYSAHDLHEDANERSGDLNGHEWQLKSSGEYSTLWSGIYLLPYLEFKEERLDFWHDDLRDKDEEAEKERQYEAGLFVNWVAPIPGWELIAGGYWQKERDAKRDPGESKWEWEDEERWIAKLKLEYESPIPGFEMELAYEEHLNGVDDGEQEFSIELSYEF